MSSVTASSSEMAIFRRIVDLKEAIFSEEAARAILRLDFSPADRQRMNELAAMNRDGKLSPKAEKELDNYIRVGQTLGILQSKARRSLKGRKEPRNRKRAKS